MGFIIFWQNYLAWTQAVAVAALIGRARHRWKKVAWHLVLISGFVVFVVQSCYLVKDYLAYNTTTNIKLIHETQAPFPAVTFCNLNPFKKSKIPHSQELNNLIATYTYVIKVKQKQMTSGTTAAAVTTATNTAEGYVRGKRQVQAGKTTGSTVPPATTRQDTARANQPATTESPNPSTTQAVASTPSTSSLATTTDPLTTTTQLPTTTIRVFTTTSNAEPIATETTPEPCQETMYTYNASTLSNYSVWSCPGGTAFVEFGGCNVSTPLRTTNFPAAYIESWKHDMAIIFYKCFHRFCTDGDCKAYNDGFDAMWAQRDCLKGGPANLACVGIVAQALGSYCSYSDSTCSLEMTGNCFMGFSFISKCDNAFPFALVDSTCNNPSEIATKRTTKQSLNRNVVTYSLDYNVGSSNNRCGDNQKRDSNVYNQARNNDAGKTDEHDRDFDSDNDRVN